MIFLRYYLWVMPHFLCAIALAFAFKKRLHAELPTFVSYLAFTLLMFATFLTISFAFSQPIYKWCHTVEVVAEFIFELAVFYEISNEIIFSHTSLRRMFRPLPRWTLASFLLVVTALAAAMPVAAQEHVMRTLQTLDFSTNLLAIGLLLALLLFSRVLGVSWRSVPAGIVLGFGIAAGAEVSGSMIMAQFGRRAYIVSDLIRMTGFHICVIIWLVYIVRARKRERQLRSGLELSDLELRLRELQKIASR